MFSSFEFFTCYLPIKSFHLPSSIKKRTLICSYLHSKFDAKNSRDENAFWTFCEGFKSESSLVFNVLYHIVLASVELTCLLIFLLLLSYTEANMSQTRDITLFDGFTKGAMFVVWLLYFLDVLGLLKTL